MTHTHKHSTGAPEQDAELAAVASAPQPASDAVWSPSHEEISIRAYLIAEARAFQGGSPEDDWFRAERELLAARR